MHFPANYPLKQLIIDLVVEYYNDFGPTLAAEKLREKHGIKFSVESVRKIMIEAQIWITRDKRLFWRIDSDRWI